MSHFFGHSGLSISWSPGYQDNTNCATLYEFFDLLYFLGTTKHTFLWYFVWRAVAKLRHYFNLFVTFSLLLVDLAFHSPSQFMIDGIALQVLYLFSWTAACSSFKDEDILLQLSSNSPLGIPVETLRQSSFLQHLIRTMLASRLTSPSVDIFVPSCWRRR